MDLILCGGVALICSALACRALIGAGIVDVPDEARKAHGAPTPTSGGIGIAFGFALGLLAIGLFSMAWRHEISSAGAMLSSVAAAFAFGFLLLGFLDDARPLGPRLKFLVFAAMAMGAAASIGVVRELSLGPHWSVEIAFAPALIGTALWVFTLVNCVNFMDGANGLAMGSVAIGLAALAAVAVMLGAPSGAAMAACGVGALGGFLIWNFPGGRLFAGDSGALFAGAIAALASLVVIARADLSAFVPPILFFPLLADALLTLAWRARRRRSLLDGHAEHLYQIAQRAGWSKSAVAITYWTAMVVCGAIGLIVAQMPDTPAPALALATLSMAAIVIASMVRRVAVRRGIAEV